MVEVAIETLVVGSQVALIAVGMTLVFGVVRFANIAQAEFATLGAYGAILAGSVVGNVLFVQTLFSVVAVAGGALASYHLVFIRLLRRSPATAMIGSLALALVIRAGIQTITGPAPQQLDQPLERGIDIAGALVTPTQLRIIAIGVAALAALMAVLYLTPLGRSIRAVSANPDLAAAAGINVRRVIDSVWLVAGGLGALGGVLIALDNQVTLDLGFQLLLPLFAVAILGGFGSAGGAILAGYILAFIEAAVLRIDFGELVGSSERFVEPAYRPAIGFVLLLLLLMYRPQGIFGRQARRA